jgi:hypothetical protein
MAMKADPLWKNQRIALSSQILFYLKICQFFEGENYSNSFFAQGEQTLDSSI